MIVIQRADETELSISASREVIISQTDHCGETHAVCFPIAHLEAMISALQEMKQAIGNA